MDPPPNTPYIDQITYTNKSFDWYFSNSSGNFFNIEYTIEVRIDIYYLLFKNLK